MNHRIEVLKEKMPYGFNITLGNEKFYLHFSYNKTADLFTVLLKKNDRVLCTSEPIVYGVPLFKDIYRSGEFPVVDLIPQDESGTESAVTWNNFGNTVFLTVV